MDKKIAYLILAHNDPEHLKRLVDKLNFKCDFYIHLDKKSDITVFAEVTTKSNVVFIKSRVSINWGGFSIVRATINLMEAVVFSCKAYSHIILLSGQDYPIKDPKKIWKLFASNPSTEFINFGFMENDPAYYKDILSRYYFRDNFGFVKNRFIKKVLRASLEKMARPIKRAYFKDMKPCFGSQWWALSFDCVKYILEFISERPYFLIFYKNSFAPDEHFFHTIVANSPYLRNVEQLPHPGRGPQEFANLHIIHPSLKKIYTVDDFDEIKQSNMFFVRNVTSLESKELLDKIDTQLLG